MKVVFLLILSALLWVDPATVRKINNAKSAAEAAFKKGDYSTAVKHYRYLVDSLGVQEDEVTLNLANASYLAKDTASAFNYYQSVTESPKTDIRSKAFQQLGIMANKQGRAEEALNFFKQSIKAEPSNDAARYNYEMLKKKLEEQKKQQEEQQQQNKDNQKQDEQNKDQQQQQKDQQDQKSKDDQSEEQQQKDQQQKDQEQQKKDQQEQQKQEEEQQKQQQQESEREEMPNLDREKLEEMQISEEKARMILEAMKNQEKQYLQQQKRKPTQSRDRNQPDW